MITCPWCGTGYTSFQSNCDNCGAALPLPAPSAGYAEEPPLPPPPPRNLPRNVLWRILAADGWAITGGILALIGAIFSLVGGVLTLTIVVALIGLPFAGIGILLLATGGLLLAWRYAEAQRVAAVLREGEATTGEIVSVDQNYFVRVGGQNPWRVRYRFEVLGRIYEGTFTTLRAPDPDQRPGRPVVVLYRPDDPQRNAIYPSPPGYWSGQLYDSRGG